jgi:hypothetical protein
MPVSTLLVIAALILFVAAGIAATFPVLTFRWEYAAACLCGAWLAGAHL